MNVTSSTAHRCLAGLPVLAIVLIGGCATAPKPPAVHYFYPPPPDAPRIQYLTSFGSEEDLGGRSKFVQMLVGADQTIHRPIWKPYGLATTPGNIYVCDTQGKNVAVIDIKKRRLRYFKPAGEASLVLPINIAVDTDGTRYITDTKRNQVLMYSESGDYLGAMGKQDEMKPCGIAIDGDRLFVTDLKNHCVRVYAKDRRELLFTIPRDPTSEDAELLSPTNLAIGDDGRIYVSDTGGFTMKVYDADGNYLRGLGDLGLSPGQFALPKGIGVDREGRKYVVDAATGVIQLFDEQDRLLMFFGSSASGPGALYLPAGVTIDYANVDLYNAYVAPGHKLEYLVFVTNQAGRKKVSVYGFLKQPSEQAD